MYIGTGNLAEEEFSKVWRIRQTCKEMLTLRGWTLPEVYANETREEFKGQWEEKPGREQHFIVASKHDSKVMIFMAEEEKKLSIKSIDRVVDKMDNQEINHGIVVSKNGLNSHANQAIADVNSTSGGTYLEHFLETELIINIMKHELVPTHEVLSDEDKKALLKKYRAKDQQLPRIPKNDPVARFLGLKLRQVVKIVRPSETAGRYVTYRIVG
eukprot:GHVL01024492.1.p1 GENE.GHVL01024492.1~~GHVL01024492.1.p1  ORF type:complete len:213 (-),score=32.59 GHVL01024492.1:306-944(-)